MDYYQSIPPVLVKLVRRNENQISFSKKMGYNFNVVSKWEGNHRKFSWNDFIVFCKHFNWNISSVLESVTHSKYSKHPESNEVMNSLLKNDNSTLEARKIFSYQKIRRLKSGEVKLQLFEFLQTLSLIYGRVDRFLNLLLGEDTAAKLFMQIDQSFEIRQKYRNIISNDPLYSMVLSCLKLGSYQSLSEHSDSFLSNILDIDESHVKFRIEHLENENIIIKKDNLYLLNTGERHIDLGAEDKSASTALNFFWHQKILKACAEKNTDPNFFKQAFLIYQSNQDLDQKVFELTKNFYRDLKNLADSVELSSTDRLTYLAIDIFNLKN